MRRKGRLFFILIILLAALSLLINLSQVYHLKFDLPNPLKISIDKKIGFDPSIYQRYLKRDLTLRRGLICREVPV